MIIAGFPAGAWGTNCYVVAPAKGEECVIVDPGQDAFDGVQEILRENRLRPVAVLLTHGHLDHMWSVVPVCDEHKVPAWIHPDDRELLSDPGKGISRALGQQIFGDMTFTEPDEVRELSDGAVLDLAGLEFQVRHAPGHTKGSVTFGTGEDGDIPPVFYSGDLLFAGSIGRTDLPGGDHAEMLRSLSRVVLPLPDETVVLSGHGPQTTIGRERATNPYLQELAPGSGPRRGM
ncbi:MBL fold metallo-hydrolase [Yinghuangia seranimata]|uniref:MBL fold metallo-hydrolase n=1 Tax=Yinghuangia seranimata TaxID=408067 RepID=UPI00248C53A5|nr:MBL fold metallo-hydrolase [Yinghuangia seranimata]MDI2132127.1 MBL fold metallo-hydrolase [Yinghuangia seranimata]